MAGQFIILTATDHRSRHNADCCPVLILKENPGSTGPDQIKMRFRVKIELEITSIWSDNVANA